MEKYLDVNIKILRRLTAHYARSNEPFNLKKALHYYIIDTLGVLAFSQTFGVQTATEPELPIPPAIYHSLQTAATTAWHAMARYLKT